MTAKGIIIIFLCIAAFFDLKKRGIPKKYLLAWGVLEISYLVFIVIWEKNVSFLIEGVVGLIPGVLCILISYISKEQMGYGDGCIILLIGFLQGWKIASTSFSLALFLLSIVAAVLLIVKKATRKTRVPFVPFLFMGYICSKLCFG